MYTLNQFRSIQRRLTLELRELGTRDRVLGDASLVMPMEQKSESKVTSTEESDAISELVSPVDQVGVMDQNKPQRIDITDDPLVDINRYRFNKKT